ncbi:MAG TPA: ATP-binding cassette domain-containing protein [Streptosporangiaceae bacterium]|jgi:zinc/manganese transport system ATP-binding protein
MTGASQAGPAAAASRTAAATTPVIHATQLASGYRGRTVWSGATFSAAPGEFLTVLGPNGAGKSTLLRMILGLLPPAAGTLRVFGEPPRRGNSDIGYVPQRRALDSDLAIGAAGLVSLGIDGHRWGSRVSPRARRQRSGRH